VDDLVWSELDVEQVDVTSGDGGFTWMMEPSEHLEERHAANPPS
jgi:hypothetical protein